MKVKYFRGILLLKYLKKVKPDNFETKVKIRGRYAFLLKFTCF